MKFQKTATLVMCILFMTVAAGLSSTDSKEQGAHELTIPAPAKGDVAFPHHDHQEELKDCAICHSLFPKSPGSISDMKSKGELKKKQVMNDLCIKCHKERKKQGLSTGPTSCSKCHA